MPEGIDEGLPQGIPEGSPETSDGNATAAPEFLNLDEFGGRLITVKVDGEELQVPLSEAAAGYQRQADYTRKTQANASDVQFAAAIRAALQTDPKGTLELLARTHNVNFGTAPQEQEEPPSWDSPAPSDDRYSSLDARLRSFEDAQASQRLDAELSRLTSKYGDEFNPQDVVTAAMAAQTTDLEGVFKSLAFDRVYSRSTASAAEVAATEAKRNASFVAGGSSAANNQADDDGPILSIRDAWAASKKSHGG